MGFLYAQSFTIFSNRYSCFFNNKNVRMPELEIWDSDLVLVGLSFEVPNKTHHSSSSKEFFWVPLRLSPHRGWPGSFWSVASSSLIFQYFWVPIQPGWTAGSRVCTLLSDLSHGFKEDAASHQDFAAGWDAVQHSAAQRRPSWWASWSMCAYFATRGEKISQSVLDGIAWGLEENYWGKSLWFLLMTLYRCASDLRKTGVAWSTCSLQHWHQQGAAGPWVWAPPVCPLVCAPKEH